MTGVLLPPSVAGALASVGLTMAGRIPVNLNFTAGREARATIAEQCRLRTTITSRSFLEKAKLEPPEGVVYIEDMLAGAKAR